MNTIAIWFDPRKENPEKNEDIELDLHINFWKLKKEKGKEFLNKFKKSETEYLLDIGFMIDDISKISNLNIFFPFKINESKIEDIGVKLNKNNDLINSVFNENYDTHIEGKTVKQLSVQQQGETLFNIYEIDVEDKSVFKIDHKHDGTQLSTCLKNIAILAKCNRYYFRIRLKGDMLLNFIRDQKPNNWFFQSAIRATETIDFRALFHFECVKLKSINLFIHIMF
jgi:hypothetical protein